MFAIVRTGGKQYRVAAGDKIVVEKIAGEAGATIALDDILLAGEGADFQSLEGSSSSRSAAATIIAARTATGSSIPSCASLRSVIIAPTTRPAPKRRQPSKPEELESHGT
jgi:hypothetical protein